MKVVWEADDIITGRVIGKPERTERWMIGYLADAEPGPSDRRYVLISMSDGMVQAPETKEMLATLLNNGGEQPVEMLPPSTRAQNRAKGGRARAASMSADERSRVAAHAANTRWAGTRERAKITTEEH